MALTMNLNASSTFSVPLGYPLRLVAAIDPMIQGVIPKSVSTVTAVVKPEKGIANAHLALYTMPTTQTGADGALVVQTDAVGITSATATTFSVAVPSSATTAPSCYVVRLWVDGIQGSTAETVARDGGTTALANLPPVPAGVVVSAITVT